MTIEFQKYFKLTLFIHFNWDI